MKVRERPRLQASHSVGEWDEVDLEASRTALDWGWLGREQVVYVKPAPCERESCGGSIVVSWGDRGCMLCGRGAHDAPPLRIEGWKKHTRERADE